MAKTRSPFLLLQAQAEIERRRRSQEAGEVQIVPGTVDFTQYQNDPVRFGVEVLGETFAPDVIRVLESVRDYPVTIARSANAVGKTHGAARVATWFYKVFKGAQVYTTAAPPEGNLRRVLWGEIGSVVNKHPSLFTEDRLSGMNITRNPMEFITGVTIPMAGTPEQREAKFNGKHAPFLLFIVDEGDGVPPEVYKGIEACLSGGFGRLLIMFNPRGAAGPVYKMERDKEANIVELTAFTHPNVMTGEDLMPGAVSREKTVRRINEWSRPLIDGENPDAETFEVPDFLVGTVAQAMDRHEYPPLPAGHRKITNPAFSYMVLGQYPAQSETQLISRSWIDAAVSRWLGYVAVHGEIPPPVRPVMGCDIAEFGKDLNVACPRYGGFVPKINRVWAGIDTDSTAIRLAGIYHDLNARWAAVDATGVGSGVAPRMERLDCNADSVKVATSPTFEIPELGTFGILRDQLWWSVREWLRLDPGAMLPPDEVLLEELNVPTYWIDGLKIRVMHKETMKELLGRSPNYADALCLTFAPEGDGMDSEYGENPVFNYRG